ncbi:MAG: sulfite exporter TauE/SafE family protein [Candidatus Pacebacteria bacterium]|nr:sulfite exporter TauE/SafE family protein [Candidatus Paceibacterota bacterium]
MEKISFKIKGTSCISCKTLIESEVEILAGIKDIRVDYKTGQCTAKYDSSKINSKKIKAVIEKLGYEIDNNKKPVKANQKINLKQWGLTLLILTSLYLLYRLLSVTNIIPEVIIGENLSYGMALIVGIVASLSTCLMVVGAVVISFSAKYENKGNFYQSSIKPHGLFHLGRLLAFFLLGGLLGVIGSLFTISATFMSWVSIIVALILIWLALDILNLAPAINLFKGGLNKKVGRKWQKLKNSDKAWTPLGLGALSFFLPCGFTQSMQIFAMASGSFISGALIMTMFALGTLPVLMGVGIASNRFKRIKSNLFKKVAGLAIIIFALYTLSSALAVQGVNINLSSQAKVEAKETQDEQVVNMIVDYRGYTPSVIKLKSGVPVKWIINGQQITGCNNEIIVPSMGIRKKLTQGTNIVKFTPNKEGTINFSCWMGMIRGKFIVEAKS